MRYIMLAICMIFLIMSGVQKRYKKIFVIMSALSLVLFATFRQYILPEEYIGVDYYSYEKWFKNIYNIEISLTNDLLFNILILIVNKLTGNYIVFIFITSLLWVFSIYKFSIENSKNYIFTIFLIITFGIFELGFSAIRQAMAISVFLLSFKYIKEKKLLKYIGCIIIASLFHDSAIVLILVYPFINIKLNILKKIIILIICAVVCTILVNSGLYERLLIDYWPDYETKYFNIGSELNSNYTVFLISVLTVLVINLLKTARKQLVNKNNYEYLFLLLLCMFSYLATLHPTLGRMLQYFMPAVALIIPETLYYEKGKDIEKVGKLVVIVLFFAIFCL